jgi:hypothetical protein
MECKETDTDSFKMFIIDSYNKYNTEFITNKPTNEIKHDHKKFSRAPGGSCL